MGAIFGELGKFSFIAYIMVLGSSPHRAVYNKCVQNSDIKKTIRMNQDRAVTAHLAQGPSPSQFGKILTFFVKLGKIKILTLPKGYLYIIALSSIN